MSLILCILKWVAIFTVGMVVTTYTIEIHREMGLNLISREKGRDVIVTLCWITIAIAGLRKDANEIIDKW